jgi:hypothetical protein
MSEYPIPPWRVLWFLDPEKECKSSFWHPEEEIQGLINQPQG